MLLSFKRVYCEAKFHISPTEMDYMVSIWYILTQQTLEGGDRELDRSTKTNAFQCVFDEF